MKLSKESMLKLILKESRASVILGPPPLRGSFFLENGTLRETREKKIFPIGSKIVSPPFLFFLILFLKSNLWDDI